MAPGAHVGSVTRPEDQAGGHMRISSSGRQLVALLVFCLLPGAALAAFQAVDLNTFTANPSASVAISAGGDSASFVEDAVVSPVSLESLSFALPANAVRLSFGYSLTVPLGNEDYFDFYLGDLSAAEFSSGGLADAVDLSFSGTHTVDVMGAAGSTVPIVFSLVFGLSDTALNSTLVIREVALELRDITIPEPGTLGLLGLGFLAFAGASHRPRTG